MTVIRINKPRYTTKVGKNKLDGKNHSVKIVGERGRRVSAGR